MSTQYIPSPTKAGIPSSPTIQSPSKGVAPTAVQTKFDFSENVNAILKEQLDETAMIAKMSMKKLHDRITSTKAIIASSAISDNVEEDLALRLEMVTLIEKMAHAAVALKELEAYTSSRS